MVSLGAQPTRRKFGDAPLNLSAFAPEVTKGHVIPLGDDHPTHLAPRVTMALVTLCVIVFLWQISQGPAGMRFIALRYGLVPGLLTGRAELAPAIRAMPSWMTVVTSMFLHGSWAHLIGNMLYLWIFANNVEDRLGHAGFAIFYLACGVLAAAAQVLPAPDSLIPMIGASGAVSGVLGAYLVLFPRANVIVFVPISFMFIHRIQAAWMLGFWFAFQFFSAVIAPADAGGVAWRAHVGGFLAGMAIAWRLRRPTPVANWRPGPWG